MNTEILNDNPILKVYEKFPWLSDSKHRITEVGEYLRLLNKFNEGTINTSLEKYLCTTPFSVDVFETLKDSFLNLSLMHLNGNYMWTAFFQPENDFLIIASVGANPNTKDLTTFFDIYTSSMEKFYNFLDSVQHYTYKERSAIVGFGT